MSADTQTTTRFHVTISRNLDGSWIMGDRWAFDIRDDDGRPLHRSFHNESVTRFTARLAARKQCRALAGIGARSERWTYTAERDG